MPDETIRLVHASGECEIDFTRRELRVRGVPVPVGGRAFEVIGVLARSAGEVVSKDELMDRVWPGAIVMESTLHVHASALRKALGPYRSLLKTESGCGYRLLGDWAVQSNQIASHDVQGHDVQGHDVQGHDVQGHDGASKDLQSHGVASHDVASHDVAGHDVANRRVASHDATAASPDRRLTRIDGASPASNFPAAAARLIGRAEAVARLRDLISAWRVVTLTGPGGIGKTTLALHVARGIVDEFTDGVWLVELASLSDPSLVPTAVAGAIRLPPGPASAMPEFVARAIGNKKLLLVVDNCEHLVAAVASLAETLIVSCPRLTILATSQETLRIQGETVYRVPALEVPALDLTAKGQSEAGEILGHSAAELFVARLRELGSDIGWHAREPPRELRAIADICRHLDGIPLAIEFAAARAALLGVEAVADGLRDRFALLTSGRRTALPRHRTLSAALDWSHALLSEAEQRLLRRLAIFAAGFSIEAAAAVVRDAGQNGAELIEGIVNLVAKSLVASEGAVPAGRWRLLESIRIYALRKLAESGEATRIARAHAEYHLGLFERAEAEWASRPRTEGDSEYDRQIDDARAALDWAFSPDGDASIGIKLAAALTPYWVRASLVADCRRYARQALSELAQTAALLGVTPDPCLVMALNAALGASQTYLAAPAPETELAWGTTLRVAREVGDADMQLRALRGLWAHRMNGGDYRSALTFAMEFRDLAGRLGQTNALRGGDRMAALILHYMGRQAEAEHLIEWALSAGPAVVPSASWYMIDQGVAARALVARILWLRGLPDQARSAADSALRRAETGGHAISQCHALAQAVCPVALWTGDLATAERSVARMTDLAARNVLPGWVARARCYRGALLVQQDRPIEGIAELRDGIQALRVSGSVAEYPWFAGVLASGLGRAGQTEQALAVARDAFAWCETSGERWCLAELSRILGALMPDDETAAETALLRGRNETIEQDTPGWGLRIASDLAGLWAKQGRRTEARALLVSEYERFTEGFETRDVRAARTLLEALR
jgi:predicted ATPase/DNA-binding winged helix-turn-helix (wHTH) protein